MVHMGATHPGVSDNIYTASSTDNNLGVAGAVHYWGEEYSESAYIYNR